NNQDSLNSTAGGNFLDKMPRECLKIIESKSKVHQSRAKAVVAKTQRVSQTDFESYVKANDAILRNMQSQGPLPGNTVTNPKEDLKGITTQSGVAYQGPKAPYPSKQGTKVTKDQVQNPISHNTAPVQPSVIKSTSQASVSEPVVAPVSALMPNLKPFIPYPSRRDNEKCCDQANEQTKKLYEIFKAMTDFVVVDFEPDPRVPLILGRCFLKTSRALIDVHKGELTLCIGNEAITYNLDHTVRYSTNYNQMTANKIDVIESACEEYSQEAYEAQTVKSSVDEPPKVELKDLPHHLEYAFLEGDNKLPIIIAKELRSEEKAALIKVLKSHKRAIAWKLSDIQGINPEFCTHKILMEEEYKLAVQNQRRVNPKIHDVIKKEVEKLLDAGLIYPISDSP
nr:hypothetical protein [Tanacetum cinerariifolium]